MEKLNARFFTIISLVWIGDFFSKIWAEKTLSGGHVIPLISDLLRFRLVYNTGGVFGILQNNAMYFHILTGLAIAFLVFYFIRTKENHPVFHTSISFILGGALGNFTDRFFRHGVVDFIDMGIGIHRFPTYNVADSFITVGAILLGITFFFLAERSTTSQEGEKDTPAQN